MWFVAGGIVIGIVSTLIDRHKNVQKMTDAEQELIENVTIIQPIVRDDFK